MNPVPLSRQIQSVDQVSNTPLGRGMGYGMLVRARPVPSPGIPLFVRSSLYQNVLWHRFQISRYISKLRNYGMRPDYPTPHVLTMINSAPPMNKNPRPTISRFGRTGSPGYMQAPRRFKKALPANDIPYYPPEY